jgi:hypothetical protein
MPSTASDPQHPGNHLTLLEDHTEERHIENVHLKNQIDDLEAKVDKDKTQLDGMEAKLDSILEMLKSQYVIYF